MNSNKKIITSAMLAALTFIFTMVIKIPSPIGGYLNLGDGIVLLGGAILSPFYAFLAAAIGSALADAASGYFIYVPATFIIKGLMALIVSLILRASQKNSFILRGLCGLLAEVVMVGGYYIFEGFLYGFIPSLVNILPNAIQGLAGIVIGTTIIEIVKKRKFVK